MSGEVFGDDADISINKPTGTKIREEKRGELKD